jgi:hypothetical protein
MQLIMTKELRGFHIVTRHRHTINSRLATSYAMRDAYRFIRCGPAVRVGPQDCSDLAASLGGLRGWRIWCRSAHPMPASFRRDRVTDRADPPQPAVWGDAYANLARPCASHSGGHRDGYESTICDCNEIRLSNWFKERHDCIRSDTE